MNMETSITLQQIVQRQLETFNHIKTAQGEVIWTTEDFSANATSPTQSTRVIFFAFERGKSVNLVVTGTEALKFPSRREVRDWSNVIAATLIVGDKVQMISQPKGRSAPEVRSVLFNPAIHENNPLTAFRPRMLADEKIPLENLVAVIGQMKNAPTVTQAMRNGHLVLRIDFRSASNPGEFLYYLIRPDQGYLPEEIGKVQNGRYVFRTDIVNGQARDNSYLPARRERIQYDSAGRPTIRESWYYRSFSANEALPRKMISLNFFLLPAGTQFYTQRQTNGTPAMK
jgi:hypothetical protein